MKRPWILGLMVSMLVPLSADGADTGSPQWRTMVVKQYGKMHDVLGGGGTKARPLVSLSEVLKKQPHAVAVGALSGLAGEITILDGQVWVARPEGAGLRVEGPTSSSAERAALLIVADVETWTEVPIPIPLAGVALERFMPGRARQQGLNPSSPFPFVIEGTFTELQMHAIRGACPMQGGAPLAQDQEPWSYRLEKAQYGKVVGFYAQLSMGNMTHPGTSIHAHALIEIDGQTVTGHVERLAVAPGAVLRIPGRR